MATISFNLPDPLVDQIDQMAADKYLNRSSLIRMVLADHVERAKAARSIPAPAPEPAEKEVSR